METSTLSPPVPSDSPGFAQIFRGQIAAIEGELTEIEADLLFRRAQAAESGPVVELGAPHVQTTVALALGSRDGSKVRVYSVGGHGTAPSAAEASPRPEASDAQSVFYRRVLDAGVGPWATWVGLPSEAAARAIDGPLSLLVVHGEPASDTLWQRLLTWTPKLAADGLLLLSHAGDASDLVAASVTARLAQGGWRTQDRSGRWQVWQPPRLSERSLTIAPSQLGGVHQVDARSLVLASRLDLAAKHLYARLAIEAPVAEWGRRVYLAHLQVWNGFYERVPAKRSPQDYLLAFDRILSDTAQSGPAGLDSIIPVSIEGSPLNGAHRIAAAVLHRRPVRTLTVEVPVDNARYDGAYFQRLVDARGDGGEPRLLLAMALEFIRLQPQCRVVTLFEHTEPERQQVDRIIADHGATVWSFSREFHGDERGALIRLMYEGEPWVGNVSNGHAGVPSKAGPCFEAGARVRFVLLHPHPQADLVAMKEEIRALCRVDKHSVHVNDTLPETERILKNASDRSAFELYALSLRRSFPGFNAQFQAFRAEVIAQGRQDQVAVSGSSAMAVFGLRDSGDLDHIHMGTAIEVAGRSDIGSHNGYEGLFPAPIPDLIFDPAYHVVVEGIRFLRPAVVRAFKSARGERKDAADLQLLATIDHGPTLRARNPWPWRRVLWVLGDRDRADRIAALFALRQGDEPPLTVLCGFEAACEAGFIERLDAADVAEDGLHRDAGRAAAIERLMAQRSAARLLVLRDAFDEGSPLLGLSERLGTGRALTMWWKDVTGWREQFLRGVAAFCWLRADTEWERDALVSWAQLDQKEGG